ncbi:hypothetical protein GCM10010430_74240 [Kitasatospora cystarginea]|uniref:Uncharacterized protein n=1 Tax=Kitasatospora cystarginea TaxID=58350 RepID=A0ABP5RVB1_9ACTN
MVLVGTGAAQVRSAVADLRLAAEENPATAEMLSAVPAGAARIEDLVQRGPAAPVWHPLNDRVGGRAGGRSCRRQAGAPGRSTVLLPAPAPPPPPAGGTAKRGRRATAQRTTLHAVGAQHQVAGISSPLLLCAPVLLLLLPLDGSGARTSPGTAKGPREK